MTAFQGSLKLIGDETDALRATVDVELGRVVVTAAGQELGSWELPEMQVAHGRDGVHIWVEEEELLFVSNRTEELARSLGARPTTQPVLQPWEPQQPPAPRPPLRPLLRAARRRLMRIPPKQQVAGLTVLGVLALALLAPAALVVGLVVVAAALVLIGGLALAEPSVQAKVPGRPLRWIIGGLAAMIAALALNLIT